jgi:hypothetical protein
VAGKDPGNVGGEEGGDVEDALQSTAGKSAQISDKVNLESPLEQMPQQMPQQPNTPITADGDFMGGKPPDLSPSVNPPETLGGEDESGLTDAGKILKGNYNK